MTQTIDAVLDLVGGLEFSAKANSGHTITLDGPPDVGGADRGARPMELLLMSLGSCTGMDVISVLRKMRQDVTGYEVRVHGERADEHPKVYTRITVEHVVRGRDLNPEMVRRSVDLSTNRYCSVLAMLEKAVPIEVSFRAIDEATGKEVGGEVALASD